MILLYIILQLVYIIDIYSIESNSFCYTSTKGYVSGVQDCTGGNIFLKGSYIEVGIHVTGSFGTSVTAPTG